MSEDKYFEQLQRIQDDINWSIILNGDEKIILQQSQEGYYTEMSLTDCKMDVRGFEHLQYATPSTINNLVSGLLEDKERKIDPKLFREDRKRIIGFKNGVFDMTTGKMRKYTSHDFVLCPLPHTIPDDIDPEIEVWFDKILSQWVTQPVYDWFKTVMAYFLFEFPNGENLWMNFFESGQNGKSSCLKLMEKIVGDEKVIGCDLAHINRFSNATFSGKWLVLGRDSAHFVNDTATSFIKNYSGDDKAVVENKGGISYDTWTSGKIIVSTNNLIQSKDRSFGWYRRMIPIPFPNTFELDPNFEKNLFRQIPNIIRVLLHRAYCYKQNDIGLSKSLPPAVHRLKEETRYLNDRVVAFWELQFFDRIGHEIKPREDMFLKVHKKMMSDVYERYEDWHHKYYGDGSVEPSLKSFGGPYGAFLTHAKKYMTYKRTRDGRTIELHPYYYDKFTKPEPPEQDDWTRS